MEAVFGFKVAKTYGGDRAKRSSELIEKAQLIFEGKRAVGVKFDGVSVVVRDSSRKVLTLSESRPAKKWWEDNGRLVADAKMEWFRMSGEGDVVRRLESEGVSRPARESVHQITEEVRTSVSDKTTDLSGELREYVKKELEELYKAVRRDISEVGKELMIVKGEVSANALLFQTTSSVELVGNYLAGLRRSVDNLLSSNSGEISEDVRNVRKKVSALTSELRKALAEYDESVRKVTKETERATGERMKGLVDNVGAKLKNLEDTIARGNDEVTRLGNVLLEQGKLTIGIEAGLNRVIRTVNALPKSFPSLERVVEVVDDLRKIVLERGNGTNLNVDTTQIERSLEGVTKSLSDLESALTSSVTPLKDEVSELTTALEKEVRNLKRVSIERDKVVGEGFKKLEGVLAEQSKASRSVEEKLVELRKVVESLSQNFPKLGEIRKVMSDTEALMAERDQGSTTKKVTKLFRDLGTRMDSFEKKITSTTTPDQGEVSQLVSEVREELRALRLALPWKQTVGVLLTRQDIREINGVLADTITDETPVDVVQARVRGLDLQVADLEKEIEGEENPLRKSLLERVKGLAEARGDTLRLKLG